MTTKEAIAWFENRISGTTMPGARMAFDMALAALREQDEQKKTLKREEVDDGWRD